MVIGAARIVIDLPEQLSLKEKRSPLRSIISRVRSTFNAAIAEVGEQDAWQTAVLGLTVVSNEAGHAARQIERIVEAIEQTRLDAEVVDRQVEIISF